MYMKMLKKHAEIVTRSKHFTEICCFQSLGMCVFKPQGFSKGGLFKTPHLCHSLRFLLVSCNRIVPYHMLSHEAQLVEQLLKA